MLTKKTRNPRSNMVVNSLVFCFALYIPDLVLKRQ
jgi:hypothetical protein